MKYSNFIKYSALCLILSVVLSLPAFAKHPKQEHRHAPKGKVISVSPIYLNVEINHSGRSNGIAPVAGAIIGGVIGNQFGSGNGNKVATVVGAVLGSAIGQNVNGKNSHYTPTIMVSHHPHASHANSAYRHNRHHNNRGAGKRFERQLVAYKVKYRYRGQIYTTRTQFHPGKYIHF